MLSKVFFRTVLGAIMMCCSVHMAHALMSNPCGWYLEANAGNTTLLAKSYPGKANPNGLGGNANVGYKFFPYLAAEIGYTQYANTGLKSDSGANLGYDKHYSYYGAARAILPIWTTGVEFFGKVGLAEVNSSLTLKKSNQALAASIGLEKGMHSTPGPYYAGGVQYYFLPELAANIQWARAKGNGDTGTMDLLSLGLSFIFT